MSGRTTRKTAAAAHAAALLEPVNATIVNIKLDKQIHEYACYSAVAEAVLAYYKIPMTQKAICATYPKNAKGKNAMQDPIRVLQEKHVFNGEVVHAPSLDDIRTEIDQGRPIICKVDRHYIVLVGYDNHSNVYLKDPIEGDDLKIVAYSIFERRGFLTQYATPEHPAGVKDYYKVAGCYLTKPPHIELGKGGGRRRRRRSTRRRARGRRTMTRRTGRL